MNPDRTAVSDLEWLLRLTLMEDIAMTPVRPGPPGHADPVPCPRASCPHGYD